MKSGRGDRRDQIDTYNSGMSVEIRTLRTAVILLQSTHLLPERTLFIECE